MNINRPNIWIITGPFQVGKTHFCNKLIRLAQTKKLNVAGVICPPVFEEELKTAITIEDLKTRETKMLARRRTIESEGLMTEHWVFDEEVLSWGNHVLAETKGCDVLLVDELGPLEFSRGAGWQNGLHAIDKGDYKIAIVVIRSSLIETAVNRWPQAKVIEFSDRLEPEKINKLVEEILSSGWVYQ